MKKIFYAFTLLGLFSFNNTITAQTSVANGNWTNPATWGGTVPVGSGTVIINHKVTLDVDYSHSSGSIAIKPAGSLTGNSVMRGFALNYPSGTASLSVEGAFDIARVTMISNVVTNSGNLRADSLLNFAIINNSGTVGAVELTNHTSGTMNNSGTINATNFLNLGSITNDNSVKSSDFFNTKNFTNSASADMVVTHNFLNTDSLGTAAIFTNNGSVVVQFDFHNAAQINGSGKFCVVNNSWNSGTMAGTIDFCDQTGTNFDLNSGTIAPTVTYCLNPCTLGINEFSEENEITIYPNPFSNSTILETKNVLNDATLTVLNAYGQIVQQLDHLNGQSVTILGENLSNGLYFIQLTENSKLITSKKLEVIK